MVHINLGLSDFKQVVPNFNFIFYDDTFDWGHWAFQG